jgi:enoyl-[acyl-carrier protein] reductase I
MMKHHADRAPLHRNVEAREVADTALFLCSQLSSGITGETIHVDCGYNVMGI